VPTRKQKRRQQKLRRHEYEEVYVDEEGNVVELDEAETDAQTPASTNGRGDRSASRPARAAQARGGRTIQPPSWRRVLKRGAIFAPVMFILVSILPGGSDISIEGRVLNTLFLVAIFLPFSYLMDTITYRIWRKRTGAG
jgi:hypothetical protein